MYPLVILCGGKAKRLGSVAKETPKSLLEFNKKPFLSYVLDNFTKQGVKDIYFCLGHLSSKYEEYLKKNKKKEVNYFLSYDDNVFSGTGGAVKKISKNLNGPFFVSYGDSYLNLDLKDLINKYNKDNSPLMTIFKNNGLYDKSNCRINKGMVEYSKKIFLDDADYIDYGLSIISPENFNFFPDSFDLSDLQEKFSKENNLQHYVVTKRFYEIGSLEGLKEFKKYVKELR